VNRQEIQGLLFVIIPCTLLCLYGIVRGAFWSDPIDPIPIVLGTGGLIAVGGALQHWVRHRAR
jgi:hypothetical protein